MTRPEKIFNNQSMMRKKSYLKLGLDLGLDLAHLVTFSLKCDLLCLSRRAVLEPRLAGGHHRDADKDHPGRKPAPKTFRHHLESSVQRKVRQNPDSEGNPGLPDCSFVGFETFVTS